MEKELRTTIEQPDVLILAKRAKSAVAKLARSSADVRNKAIALIADTLEKEQSAILAANQKDLDTANKPVANGQMSAALYSRLKLDADKIDDLVEGMRQLAASEDLLNKITLARELDEGLKLYRVTCPIGVIAVIFEARPDVLPQIVSLTIKSGNACILKGGQEAKNTNLKLFELIDQAVRDSGLPADAVTLIESREEINHLLKADHLIDLVIPRGSNELVKKIQNNTRIPVLGHAEGICHIYVDKEADLKVARAIVIDAKSQYPAACNAVETVLIHQDIAETFLPALAQGLKDNGVSVKADSRAIEIFNDGQIVATLCQDWSIEYCDLTIAIAVLDSIDAALEHINQYGSGHTDSIITQDKVAAEHFFASVNSANVFINASTRFADGFRYGFGAEVGISTGKLHPRGPVGVEGLVTYKYKLLGEGQIVGDYVGPNAKKFRHRNINLDNDELM